MNFDKDHNIDTFINYLECVGRTSFSLENIIMEDNALGRHYKELYKDINMIIIVDNYGSSDTKLVIQMLIEQGIKHLCILKGGIQAAKLDAKEKLQYNNQLTPLSYYKREIKRMKEVMKKN